MNCTQLTLLCDHISNTPDAIDQLRSFVLDFAVRGKLVKQDVSDESASALINQIAEERNSRKKNGFKRWDNITVAPFELPMLWHWGTLGEIFQYDAGIKCDPSILDPSMWLLELEDIEKCTGNLLKRMLVGERNSKSTKSKFSQNDILYSKLNPHLNKVMIADQEGYSTTEIVALRPYVPLCSEYCALAIRSPYFVEYSTHRGLGMKMPRLRTKDAINAPFPLPPLKEQYRIVAKVNELMDLCDQLKKAQKTREEIRANFTRASLLQLNTFDSNEKAFQSNVSFALSALPDLSVRTDQIKQLRQVILSFAVSGKLVRQNPNDEPASQLLKKIADEKERSPYTKRTKCDGFNDVSKPPPFPVPRNWRWVCIEEITTNRGQKIPDIPFTYVDVSAIDKECGIVVSPRVIQPENAPSRARKIAELDDVIYSCVRPYLLNIAVIEDIFDPPLIVSTAFEVMNGHGYVLPRYIWIALRSPYMVDCVEMCQRGIAYPAIKSTDFRLLPFPLPPLAEQHRIVAKFNELMALCDQLEENISISNNSRSNLITAILHEALNFGVSDPQNQHI